jgi:hypothetical protein
MRNVDTLAQGNVVTVTNNRFLPKLLQKGQKRTNVFGLFGKLKKKNSFRGGKMGFFGVKYVQKNSAKRRIERSHGLTVESWNIRRGGLT